MKFGTTPISDKDKFLNKIKNITSIPIITKPKVRIWEVNKLCKRLLKSTRTPAILNSSFLKFNLFSKSYWILFIRSFLLKLSLESFILKLILASLSLIDI